MIQTIIIAAGLLAASVVCQSNCVEEAGNWYCESVQSITYTSVGSSGSYNRVTSMDNATGSCTSTPYDYSGSLAPFDEELSLHIRGPIQLKYFAAYSPRALNLEIREESHRHVHGHAHSHLRGQHVKKRAAGAIVTDVINGQTVSWTNEYTGLPTPGSVSSGSPEVPDDPQRSQVSMMPSNVHSTDKRVSQTAQPSVNSPGTDNPPSRGSGSGSGWIRTAYYDAERKTSSGLVFLNHYGGAESGSGVWDSTFGSSLSYASPSGMNGSSTSQVLADTIIPSSGEIVIMTDEPCGEENGSCGYYRPGTVAYHGFDGAEKVFLLEFVMPSDGQTTSDVYDPVNMPAVWFLNAQIPRTVQYGQPTCSCWSTYCGEFDVFEVLTPGYTKAKSTVHGHKAGGDSNYFVRPESGSLKVSIVLSGDNFHIQTHSESVDFGPALSHQLISNIVKSSMSTGNSEVSVYSLADAGPG